jgi:hypothetical protein
MKSLKTLVDYLFAMEKTTTNMAIVLALAFGLILGSIGSASLVHAQQQANTSGDGGNMTGKTTGPGGAVPGNVTNPTNATKSPSAVGGSNMTSPNTAKAANETASMQSGNNKSMAGGSSSAGNATQSGNQTNSSIGNMLSKIPIIGKILGGK